MAACIVGASGCYAGVEPQDGEAGEVAAEGSSGSSGSYGSEDDGAADGGWEDDSGVGEDSGGAADSSDAPGGGEASGGSDEPGTTGGDEEGAGTSGGDEGSSDTSGGDEPGGSDPGGDGGDAPPASDDVPSNAYCNPVAAWDPAHAALEEEILALVNQHRASGADCGSKGSFGPAQPLVMDPALRCAARVHSKDMADRQFFDHTNPSGESPWDRFEKAGYSYSRAGENIAGGSSTAAGTMSQWMNSDGHCANIMNPNFEEIGVGYYPGGPYGHLWTQTFGTP